MRPAGLHNTELPFRVDTGCVTGRWARAPSARFKGAPDCQRDKRRRRLCRLTILAKLTKLIYIGLKSRNNEASLDERRGHAPDKSGRNRLGLREMERDKFSKAGVVRYSLRHEGLAPVRLA
jgi:hypothetical protein